MKVFCGIDWAEKHHDIALVDAEGKFVAKRRVKESVEGFAELTTMLAQAGDSEDDPIPVAIETPRGLLVAALRASGRTVYPINPMAVARYRERHSVSRKKSDHVDAMTLANILRTDAPLHRPLPADSELARAIGVLARAHQDATWCAPRPATSCVRCCASTPPGSWKPSPAATPPTWPTPTPARSWPSPTPAAAAKLTKARITAALAGADAYAGPTSWPP